MVGGSGDPRLPHAGEGNPSAFRPPSTECFPRSCIKLINLFSLLCYSTIHPNLKGIKQDDETGKKFSGYRPDLQRHQGKPQFLSEPVGVGVCGNDALMVWDYA